jgi:hypothetical protein
MEGSSRGVGERGEAWVLGSGGAAVGARGGVRVGGVRVRGVRVEAVRVEAVRVGGVRAGAVRAAVTGAPR